jgi:hypothetical protein
VEVPQLFCKATVATIVLIAGTTIGGGTLALPAAAAPAGFVPAAAALVGCWLFLFVEAVLLVEVSVRMKAEGTAKEGEVRARPISTCLPRDTPNAIGIGPTYLGVQFLAIATLLGEILTEASRGTHLSGGFVRGHGGTHHG